MNFGEVSVAPLLIAAFFITSIASFVLLILELYNKEAIKKWGSQFITLISSNAVKKGVLIGVTIVSLIIYLLARSQIVLLIFALGLGICLSWLITSITYQVGSKILLIDDKSKRRLLNTLLTIADMSLVSFVTSLLFFLLSITIGDELVDVYYALMALTFAYVVSSFSPYLRKSGTTYDGIILSTNVLKIALTGIIILSDITFKDNYLYLNYTFIFMVISFLVMAAVTYAGLIKIKDKSENGLKNKDETLKIYNFATLIILGIVFLPLSYVLFKDTASNKLGGFDLGFLSLLSLVLQIGLTSTLDSITKTKNSALYFSLLSLIAGAVLIILYDYLLPVYGFAFAIISIVIFESYTKWYFTDNESNVVSLNLAGILLVINSLFNIKSLFELHEGLAMENALTLSSVIPLLFGLCFSIFAITSYKDKGKENIKWFASFIFLSMVLVVLVNTLFGYGAVIYLTLGFSLFILVSGELEKDITDRLYLSLSFILASTLLIEVVYYLNQGVGMYLG